MTGTEGYQTKINIVENGALYLMYWILFAPARS